MTPQEALDAIQSRLEAFEASVAYLPNYMSPEMDAAVQVLADFIKQVNEHGSTDLEWGNPGECGERISNDLDIANEIGNGLTPDEFQRAVVYLGLGRHYGDPHCIWCLQAD